MLTPPTHFRTNKFTRVFQETIDTYGVPRYREANPALLTSVTFPFLFGVMFGDVGHGSLLLLTGLFLCLQEERVAQFLKRTSSAVLRELGGMLFAGRYMLLLMGCFALYMGLIYNECFSLTLDLFGSRWTGPRGGGSNRERVQAAPYGSSGSVYPFGMDPEWVVSQNSLVFANSFKMKMAVILGVTQMTVGVLLKASNHVHFGDLRGLLAECAPQLVFILCIFNYMNYMIVLKWTMNWDELMAQGRSPPSIVNTMIQMALTGGGLGPEPELYPGQVRAQTRLMLAAGVSVPLMFLARPCLEHRSRRGRSAHGHEALPTSDKDAQDDGTVASDVGMPPSPGQSEHAPHSLGDALIHQAIEMIEYVIGCVSNTASYLRLWALSLAHAELAKTFWEMIMASVLARGGALNFFVLAFAYSAFAGCTLGVLMLMDVLECYLHALRLHWVEFQNKFYKADGYAFAPFAVRQLLRDCSEDLEKTAL
jgi:V-type H+-transporting ATPase subunit a